MPINGQQLNYTGAIPTSPAAVTPDISDANVSNFAGGLYPAGDYLVIWTNGAYQAAGLASPLWTWNDIGSAIPPFSATSTNGQNGWAYNPAVSDGSSEVHTITFYNFYAWDFTIPVPATGVSATYGSYYGGPAYLYGSNDDTSFTLIATLPGNGSNVTANKSATFSQVTYRFYVLYFPDLTGSPATNVGLFNIYLNGARITPSTAWIAAGDEVTDGSGNNAALPVASSLVSQAAAEAALPANAIYYVHNGGSIGVYLPTPLYQTTSAGAPNPTYALLSIAAPMVSAAQTGELTPCGGTTQTTLSWPAMPCATSYNVYSGATPGGPYTPVGSTSGLCYAATTWPYATTYFVVTALYTSQLESPYSNETNSGAPLATITPTVHSDEITYFNGGADYAPGPYRCCYVAGAYEYDPRGYPPYGLTVNGNLNIQNPTNVFGLAAGYYITNGNGSFTPGPGLDANFSTQGGCESANAGQSVVFQHAGGPVGVFLVDDPYWDNFDGSPSPTFTLAGPGPVLQFSASPAGPNVQGTSVTLFWTVSNSPTSVTIDHGIGSVGASGTLTVAPTVTTTYTISAVGAASIPNAAQVTVEVGSPGAVQYVQGQGNCSGEILLNWGASSFASSYRVQQSPAGAENWTTVGTTSATSFSVTPPNAFAAYDYSIQAFDGLNYGPAGTINGLVAGRIPAAPTAFSATALNGSVVLAASASTGALSYNLYRGLASGQETLLVSGLAGPGFTDTRVRNGIPYFYKLTALSPCGESAASAEVSATPLETLQPFGVNHGDRPTFWS